MKAIVPAIAGNGPMRMNDVAMTESARTLIPARQLDAPFALSAAHDTADATILCRADLHRFLGEAVSGTAVQAPIESFHTLRYTLFILDT
ncbi:hypothetical protein PQQ71_22780 [Paraburkholderia dipogonis]